MDSVVLMGDARVAAIPAHECGDQLVDLAFSVPELAFMPLDVNPQRSRAYTFLRGEVAQRLLQAQQMLPEGYRLLLSEGYRPYDLQDYYFSKYRRRLLDADPTLSSHDADVAVTEFVSPPDLAPHVSGAAIDLTLSDADGEELDMGSPIDTSPQESGGACYFAAPNISRAARQNRVILAIALTSSGLVNYPTEWWHWSFGDRYWALMTGSDHAIFGPLPSPIVEPHAWRDS